MAVKLQSLVSINSKTNSSEADNEILQCLIRERRRDRETEREIQRVTEIEREVGMGRKGGRREIKVYFKY